MNTKLNFLFDNPDLFLNTFYIKMSNLLILNYLTCNDERLLICLKRLLIREFNFKDLNKLDLITLIYLYTKVFFLELKLIF